MAQLLLAIKADNLNLDMCAWIVMGLLQARLFRICPSAADSGLFNSFSDRALNSLSGPLLFATKITTPRQSGVVLS
jgi:hypothetical protein